MSNESKEMPNRPFAAATGSDVLPLPLGLAQRSAKCRICGESFSTPYMPTNWAYAFKEQLWPVHIILNHGKECAHAKCLERQNDERSDRLGGGSTAANG
jgi:hypothetical protein